jgi:zinc transporter 1/2/3
MQVLDYFVTVKIAGRAPPSLAADGDDDASGSSRPSGTIASSSGHNHGHNHGHSHGPPSIAGSDDGAADAAEAGVCVVHSVCKDEDCGGHSLLKPKVPTLKSQVAAVFMSEASIAVHSVLIGITLGVTHGDEIVPLLIALTFHQFLEGVAIGSAAIYAGMAAKSVVYLGLIFAVTTPVGIAIGLGVRGSYNGSSSAALITQGTLDAVCAGMLIFLALGDHVNAVKSQAHWLKREGAATHGLCIGAFLAGVAIMCTLALWV